MIAITFFFAIDNVMGWLSSPFIFYPLMFVAMAVALMYTMGLGGLLGPVATQSINLALRRFNFNF